MDASLVCAWDAAVFACRCCSASFANACPLAVIVVAAVRCCSVNRVDAFAASSAARAIADNSLTALPLAVTFS